jgi:hypothetical protein
MNFKKIALILAFIIFSVGVGYLLYRFFFAPAPATTVPTPGVTTPVTGGLPSAGTGHPTTPVTGGGALPSAVTKASPVANGGVTETPTVTEAPVLAPTVATDGNLNFYNQTDGKFYHQLPDGTLQSLSSKSFPNVSQVDWSPKGDKAILEFPDQSKVIYDFAAARQVTIPKQWSEFSFSGDGNEIAAKSLGDDPSNRWLITFDSDGSNAQVVSALGDNADKVTVSFAPGGQSVAFSDTGDAVGFDQRDMLVVGRNNENFKPLSVNGFGFIPKWSPDGANVIYSAASQSSDYLPELWFSGAVGANIDSNRTDLGVKTWADLCTFADSATVYCAVPDSLDEGAGLQRDVATGTPDSLVRIDLKNGNITTVGRPDTGGAMKDLTVAADGSKLWFTDPASGQLREMRLK